MTDFTRFRSRTRDIQDYVERGVYGAWSEVPGAGAMVSVRGTGTLDEEVPIYNPGYGFRLPDNSNAEVVMLSLGSDVNDKVALLSLPRDQQHVWGEGQGGVQHPMDPARRLEFNADETWLKDGAYRLGNNREVAVTVRGGAVSITIDGNAEIVASGDMELRAASVNIESPTLTHNGINIGDTHRHGGVESGGSTSGGPQ